MNSEAVLKLPRPLDVYSRPPRIATLISPDDYRVRAQQARYLHPRPHFELFELSGLWLTVGICPRVCSHAYQKPSPASP